MAAVVLLFWAVSIAGSVAATAYAQRAVRPAGKEPEVVSGADVGFRVDHYNGEAPVGELVVKHDGKWVAVSSARASGRRDKRALVSPRVPEIVDDTKRGDRCHHHNDSEQGHPDRQLPRQVGDVVPVRHKAAEIDHGRALSGIALVRDASSRDDDRRSGTMTVVPGRRNGPRGGAKPSSHEI